MVFNYILAIVLLLYFIFTGQQKGFFVELDSRFSWILSLFLSCKFIPIISNIISINIILIFLIIIILSIIIIKLIAKKIVRILHKKRMMFPIPIRIFGGILGVLGCIFLMQTLIFIADDQQIMNTIRELGYIFSFRQLI